MLSDVLPGSPAERAGLRPGDRLLSVAGRRMDSWSPLFEALRRGRPGDVLALELERPGHDYLLVQRGFLVLLGAVELTATLAFSAVSSRWLVSSVAPGGVVLGVVSGFALVWSGQQLHRRVSERIDRAFFRAAYDARHLLEQLAVRAREATDRTGLAALLEEQLGAALQPRSLSIYLAGAEATLRGVARGVREFSREEQWDDQTLIVALGI